MQNMHATPVEQSHAERGEARSLDRAVFSQAESPAPRELHAAAVAAHRPERVRFHGLSYDDPLAILGSAPYPDAPWWRRLSPSTVFVLLASAIAVFFLMHELAVAGSTGYPGDASWLHQVFARGFFHDLSFEFGAAGPDRTGTTAPFWVVFLAMGGALFHDPIVAGKLLGTIFLFLIGYYTFRLLRLLGSDYGSSLLGAATIMVSPTVSASALSGLETPLAAALLVGALWFNAAMPHSWRRSVGTGVLFALMTLTRPESGLLFITLLVADLPLGASRGHRERRWMTDLIMPKLAFAFVLAPVALTNMTVSGRWYPRAFDQVVAEGSALRYLLSGHLLPALRAALLATESVWTAVTEAYPAAMPLWCLTIPVAWWVRARHGAVLKHYQGRTSLDALFDRATLMALATPWLYTCATGRVVRGGGSFAPGGVLPADLMAVVYLFAGVLSVSVLIRYGLFRSFTLQRAAQLAVLSLAVSGVAALVARSGDRASYALVPANIDLIVFGLFFVVLLVVALRHTGLMLFGPDEPFAVTEEERRAEQFELEHEATTQMSVQQLHHPIHAAETQSRVAPTMHLTLPMISVLRLALLLALVWGSSQMPRAADDHACAVRSITTDAMVWARAVAQTTQPGEIIATDRIGLLGWVCDRPLLELGTTLAPLGEDELTAEWQHLERGRHLNLLALRSPASLAAIQGAIQSGSLRMVSSGLFRPIRP